MQQCFGPNELLEDVFQRDLCVNCGMCVDVCPYFKTYRGKTTQVFKCDQQKGACYACCPKTEVDLDRLSRQVQDAPYDGRPLGRYRRIAIARAGIKAPRGHFQGGGTVSALTVHALTSGAIDCAVLTGREGLVPVSMLAADRQQVVSAAGSKFMAAPTLSALNRAMREGYTKIGVVGTPCQITAVTKMRCNPLEKEDFADPVALTIGLFCTWAVDTRKLIPVAQACVDASCILAMDVPPPPAEILVLATGSGGRAQIPLSTIRSLVPHGCRLCPDMTSEWADISVGQVEGTPGWNTVVVRTAKGDQAFHQAIAAGYLEVGELAEGARAVLERAGARKKGRAVETAAREGRLNTDASVERATLRIPPEALEKIRSNNN
jgi:coenzyme F420 hydrogenase subunit beta